jgi:hypothetical protein
MPIKEKAIMRSEDEGKNYCDKYDSINKLQNQLGRKALLD